MYVAEGRSGEQIRRQQITGRVEKLDSDIPGGSRRSGLLMVYVFPVSSVTFSMFARLVEEATMPEVFVSAIPTPSLASKVELSKPPVVTSAVNS